MMEIWIEKYRPSKLSEIYGQEEVVSRLKSFVKEKQLPHLIFAGPAGVGKTSAAIALTRELLGENWRDSFLELNASDERGIDVIRENVKEFARIKPFNDLGLRIIFLDEADHLTPEAQAALRRTMEKFSSTTRFIFSCNYSTQIIPPIQSRTVVMRFHQLSEHELKSYLKFVADKEEMKLDDDAIEAISDVCSGDARKAVSILQTLKYSGETSPKIIFEMSGNLEPADFEKVFKLAMEGLFDNAVDLMESLTVDRGYSAIDIIKGMHSFIRKQRIAPKQKLSIIMALAEAEFRLVEGG
ncbi:replication factor C small subunit, partial [mine drainage metagenome]